MKSQEKKVEMDYIVNIKQTIQCITFTYINYIYKNY